MENAWQYSKVFEHHVGEDGEPSDEYWRWATEGWANPDAVRYPMGKGVRPAYCYWDGRRLTYVAARHQVYWPLYRNAVAGTAAFRKLQELAHAGKELVLFDFDGYHHEAVNMSLHQAISSPYRPMGHAFILKAMLELGANVTPDDVGRADRGVEQLALF
jgi:hypothetical protein